MVRYLRATGLREALAALADAHRDAPSSVIAGATDHYPAEASRKAWFGRPAGNVIDISGIPDLRGIDARGENIRIGALATWSDVMAADLPPAFAALKQAARHVGGVQIQNRGTIGGNICNASPAADSVPPLLALDAVVELASLDGVRRMPLHDFIRGNRTTALLPGEILTAVHVPRPHDDERSVFLKLGARRYLIISIVSVAANLRFDSHGCVAAARIAVGACSPAPIRLGRIEKALYGQYTGSTEVTLTAADGLSPIDDVRASAAYRLDAAETLLRRALRALDPALREAA
jgi:CO/xanthine dehydrogenase FAD-binding subunit